ncbi:hypothetical protein D3C85_1884360 [compost metagenome]
MGAALVAGEEMGYVRWAPKSAGPPSRTSPILRRMGVAHAHEEKNNSPPAREPISGAPTRNTV